MEGDTQPYSIETGYDLARRYHELQRNYNFLAKLFDVAGICREFLAEDSAEVAALLEEEDEEKLTLPEVKRMHRAFAALTDFTNRSVGDIVEPTVSRILFETVMSDQGPEVFKEKVDIAGDALAEAAKARKITEVQKQTWERLVEEFCAACNALLPPRKENDAQ